MAAADVIARTTTVDGVRFVERTAGSGPPIVFVHGLAVSSRYFVPLLRVLGDRYTCRALDLPGFGSSGQPAAALSVPGMGRALAAWLRANGLTDAALVGNSAGCQYIVDCVSRHRDITGPLVLIGPTTDAAARTPAAQIGRWLRCGLYADIAQAPLVAVDIRDAGLRRVAATFRAVLDDTIESKLPLVRQPALVVRGSKDPLAPRAWCRQVDRLLAHSTLVEIPGGAHVVNFTRPAQVGAVIDSFLQDPWRATS